MNPVPLSPTLIESGVQGMEMDASWYGVFAPAKTPAAIVSQLHGEIREALATPSVRDGLATIGMTPAGTTPAEFKQFVQTAIRRYAEMVRLAGIHPE